MKTKSRKKKTVIKNKRRFTAFITFVIILTCCGFSSVKSYVSESDRPTVSVYVTPGDTLWTLASDNNPNNKDIRNLVHEIKKYNKLNSNTIQVGEEIHIPL